MNKITLEETKQIAYEAFVYAYPMLQQIKTINGMMKFVGLAFNEPVFNPGLPWETVGQPIVCPNLTSMSGGILVGTTYGPVTIEIPEVKDRYIVYQCIDAFTHNTYYMGTRANNGDGGRFTFYNKGQQLPDLNATPIELESNHAIIVIRIDIAEDHDLKPVANIINFGGGTSSMNAASLIRFYTASDTTTTTGTERMAINGAGNVGIGTSDPDNKLDVAGSVNAYEYLVNGTAISAGSLGPVTGEGTYGYVPMWNGTQSLNNSNIYQGASGNVGIGTTSPSEKLEVAGTAKITGSMLIGETNITTESNGDVNVW